jgi:hypothetical protein
MMESADLYLEGYKIVLCYGVAENGLVIVDLDKQTTVSLPVPRVNPLGELLAVLSSRRDSHNDRGMVLLHYDLYRTVESYLEERLRPTATEERIAACKAPGHGAGPFCGVCLPEPVDCHPRNPVEPIAVTPEERKMIEIRAHMDAILHTLLGGG